MTIGRDIESSHVIEDWGDSTSRRIWKGCTWILTWWIPSFLLEYCGGMRRPDVRFAWREKVALFMLFVFASAMLLFFIIGVPIIICPKQNVLSIYDVSGKNSLDNAYVAAYGRYYEITSIVDDHINKIGADKFKMQAVLGQDVSQMFFPTTDWSGSCPGITNPGPTWDNIMVRNPSQFYPHTMADPQTNQAVDYMAYLGKYSRGRIGWVPQVLANMNKDPTMKPIIMYGNVYNVAAYFQGQSKPGFFDENMYNVFTNVVAGQDATGYMQTLMTSNPVYYRQVLNCMNHLFYIGVVDNRGALKCTLANYIMFAASGIICAVLFIKFVAAFNFGEHTNPSQIDRYVMVQIPCFTEDRASLELTLNSIATAGSRSSDDYKLAVVLCDGNITGDGNNKSTPDIVLEILYGNEEGAEVAKKDARAAMSYHAVGEGKKGENKAQIYSGRYECEGHQLPFIVVIKTGLQSEQSQSKPGNRGKRDSQILLMRFLHHIYARKPLTELEYGLYHEMKYVMGVAPEKYEFMLMVDADTFISKESINKLVYHMIKDEDTVGLSGETLVANENKSWAARIQPYEYFISHHLAKAFESLFGSVTCLPGCFCMYRIRTEKNVPCLIAPALIEEYAQSNVNTLHKKNLLHLGEDRFLTTLVLKNLRGKKTRYTADAHCHTNVPDSFGVLISQRRRWINSTIHNLLELVNMEQLCGFCCFSMRFIVFLDLISTIVAPAAVVYVMYLLAIIFVEKTNVYMVSLIMIGAIYGLQLIIIIVKMKWSYIAYMIFYVLAMPYFSLYLPLYSFWNMDDFNWGNTRVAINNGKKEEAIIEDFDPAFIPRKSITEWEAIFRIEDADEIAFKDCKQSYPMVPTMTAGSFPPPPLSMPGFVPPPMMPFVHPPASIYGGSQYGMGDVQSFPATSAILSSQHPGILSSSAFPTNATNNYAGSYRAPSNYGGQYYPPVNVMQQMSSAPSHVASYVGQYYPPPSTYAPSIVTAVRSDTSESRQERRARRERRKQRRLERERESNTEAGESVSVRDVVPIIELPSAEKTDWDDLMDLMDKRE